MTVSRDKMDQEGSPSPTVRRRERREGARDGKSCAVEVRGGGQRIYRHFLFVGAMEYSSNSLVVVNVQSLGL